MPVVQESCVVGTANVCGINAAVTERYPVTRREIVRSIIDANQLDLLALTETHASGDHLGLLAQSLPRSEFVTHWGPCPAGQYRGVALIVRTRAFSVTNVVTFSPTSDCARFHAEGRLLCVQCYIGSGDRCILVYTVYNFQRQNNADRLNQVALARACQDDGRARGLPFILIGDWNREDSHTLIDAGCCIDAGFLGTSHDGRAPTWRESHHGEGSTRIDYCLVSRDLAACVLDTWIGTERQLPYHEPSFVRFRWNVLRDSLLRSVPLRRPTGWMQPPSNLSVFQHPPASFWELTVLARDYAARGVSRREIRKLADSAWAVWSGWAEHRVPMPRALMFENTLGRRTGRGAALLCKRQPVAKACGEQARTVGTGLLRGDARRALECRYALYRGDVEYAQHLWALVGQGWRYLPPAVQDLLAPFLHVRAVPAPETVGEVAALLNRGLSEVTTLQVARRRQHYRAATRLRGQQARPRAPPIVMKRPDGSTTASTAEQLQLVQAAWAPIWHAHAQDPPDPAAFLAVFGVSMVRAPVTPVTLTR